jgi:hypothetical protein
VVARSLHPRHVVGISLDELVPLAETHDRRPRYPRVGEPTIGDRSLPAQPQPTLNAVGQRNLVDASVALPISQPTARHEAVLAPHRPDRPERVHRVARDAGEFIGRRVELASADR